MKIESKLVIKDHPHDRHYDLEVGDIVTVPDDVGAYWVANGWAKNLDTGKNNEPSDNPVTLDIHNSMISVNNTGG